VPERSGVADIPDSLVLKRHRDLVGRDWHRWVRWSLMTLVAVLPLLALANVFGQHASTARAGVLTLRAPTTVRSGVLFGARFTIRPRAALRDATLVLDPGWGDGLTINTLEPSPVSEGSRNGAFVFKLGHVPAGGRFDFFLQFQVNPTAVGNRSQDVVLFDGSRRVASISRTLTIFP
jgi:hypothetical protein